MVEIVGDYVEPSEFRLPVLAAASLPTAPTSGMMYFDSTNNKIVFWNGSAYETVTSA